MAQRPLSRRVFIHRLGFFGGGVVLLGSACKKGQGEAQESPSSNARVRKPLTTAHLTFTSEEFSVVQAACERIVPKDEDPGAAELGVPKYIDRMLQSPQLAQMKEDFLTGVNALDRRARQTLKVGFAQATAAQQDALLAAFKDAGDGTGEAHFYELLVVLTLEGLLGDPSYGGNKDKAGWALVGFNVVGHQAAEPPPGYHGGHHLQHKRGH